MSAPLRFAALCALSALALPALLVAQAEPVPLSSVSPEQLIGAPLGPPLSGAELDRQTDDLSSIMRCPVCQALSVNDSPSLSAIAMKEEIRDLLATGYTRQQTMAYFEQAYGEFIRLEPRARGFNLFVWLAPVVALLLGAALVARRITSRRGAPARAEASGPAAASSDELESYLDRVRREVES